ncbi:hypothetical protein EYF80_040485 [Liparis tanakae]|uniref:Uncharacterized protein n=1 Tax=Liparis tanakae TaxID=230148 RepID=A0A4Z2G845_9TELE|nr:hypothetical protein EYF80_040485 [Liparis tanakae]
MRLMRSFHSPPAVLRRSRPLSPCSVSTRTNSAAARLPWSKAPDPRLPGVRQQQQKKKTR